MFRAKLSFNFAGKYDRQLVKLVIMNVCDEYQQSEDESQKRLAAQNNNREKLN